MVEILSKGIIGNLYPALFECGLVCIPHGMNVYLPIAFCVLKNDSSVTQSIVEEELLGIAKADLPDFDAPVKYYFKDELPHTGQGKIDYRLLE